MRIAAIAAAFLLMVHQSGPSKCARLSAKDCEAIFCTVPDLVWITWSFKEDHARLDHLILFYGQLTK